MGLEKQIPKGFDPKLDKIIIEEQESLPIKGKWRLTARHIKTGEVIVKEGENLIVTVGKVLVCQMLIDAAGYDTGLTWCAIGTNAAAPTLADIALGTESVRKIITTRPPPVGNVITLTTFFNAGESNFDLKEAGIFGHSTAGAGVDSGILFSHWLSAFDNSLAAFDLTFDLVLSIGV